MCYGLQKEILYNFGIVNSNNSIRIRIDMGMEYIVIIILSVLLIILLIKYIMYRRQIVNICRQLTFVKENETNKIINTDIAKREVLELVELINMVNEEHKAEQLEIKAKDAHMREALANVSHDIRTPLTSLKGYFELLSSENDDEKKKCYTGIINNKLIELTDLLEELFTYTKLQNEEYNLELSEYDFTKLVIETLFAFYSEFKKRDIITDIDISEESVMVVCNDIAVKRLISNIIKNALLHGSGRINILYKVEGKHVKFRCENNLDNPAEIDISQVFDRFYKADAARSRSSTGLGLSIARGLAEKMGGSIEASIEDGNFIISLIFDAWL